MTSFSTDLLRRATAAWLEDAASAHFEPIRTGKFNSSYFVQTADGEYVLRIAPPPDSEFVFYERDMMRQEPELHRILRERTRTPVARVISYDDSRSVLSRDFILMERLPGQPMSDAAMRDPDGVLREAGRCLSEVHNIHADRYGYLGAHRPMEPQSTWPDAFALMWRKLLEDVERSGHYTAKERDWFVKLHEQHAEAFDRPVASSLLHMDVWAQNILVENGRLTGLIDWDRALWGDSEIEFAVLDYCGISQPAFWEGYGRVRDESEAAQIRRAFYLLYELQKYIVIEQGRRGNAASARAYKQRALQWASELA